MGGGGSAGVNNVKADTPDVYVPTSPTRTVADTPDSLGASLFSEGATRSDTELEKKSAATSRLIIPLDSSQSSVTGGTTTPATPTGVV